MFYEKSLKQLRQPSFFSSATIHSLLWDSHQHKVSQTKIEFIHFPCKKISVQKFHRQKIAGLIVLESKIASTYSVLQIVSYSPIFKESVPQIKCACYILCFTFLKVKQTVLLWFKSRTLSHSF